MSQLRTEIAGGRTRPWSVINDGQAIGPISSYGLALWGMRGLLYPGDVLVHSGRHRVQAGMLSGLQPFIRNDGHLHRAKIWAFASGKGGVGKSTLCALMGAALARQGRRTVVVDGDFHGANQHVLFNVNRRRKSYWPRLVDQPQSIAEWVMPTAWSNLGLVTAPSPVFGKGQLDILHKIRFIEALRSLNADFVLLDLGPGIDEETLDFFVTADNQILVTMPETTALENLAVFLRNVFNHKIDTVLQSLGLIGQEMDLRQGRLPAVQQAYELLLRENLPAQDIVRRAVSSLNVNILYNQVHEDDRLQPNKLLQKYLLSETAIQTGFIGKVGFAPSLHQLVREKSLLRGDFPLLPLDSDVRQNVLRLCSSELFRQVDLSRLPLRSHFVKSDLIYCGTWCSSWNDCPYQSPGYPCPARNLN
ncbi:MAG TPA: MinD/ParA family protein [bacterium]|nr:MinD/ParA family protein [bacterium]